MDYRVTLYLAPIGSILTVKDESLVVGALPIDQNTVGIVVLNPARIQVPEAEREEANESDENEGSVEEEPV